MGQAAAAEAAEVISQAIAARGAANVILATGNSQLTFLRTLREMRDIDWSAGAGLSHGRVRRSRSAAPGQLSAVLAAPLPGLRRCRRHSIRWLRRSKGTEAACREYEALLRQYPADLCACGIGENGHLAFNDPPYADFDDPLWVKVVQLDERSRRQQVGEGHFASLDEVPTHAVTLTIPALLAAGRVLCIVPEARKADAVLASLRGPVTEDCPASFLRTQPHARLYLDPDSAALLD